MSYFLESNLDSRMKVQIKYICIFLNVIKLCKLRFLRNLPHTDVIPHEHSDENVDATTYSLY